MNSLSVGRNRKPTGNVIAIDIMSFLYGFSFDQWNRWKVWMKREKQRTDRESEEKWTKVQKSDTERNRETDTAVRVNMKISWAIYRRVSRDLIWCALVHCKLAIHLIVDQYNLRDASMAVSWLTYRHVFRDLIWYTLVHGKQRNSLFWRIESCQVSTELARADMWLQFGNF